MIDSNGIETTAEYYIVRIYRRRSGKDGEQASLIGVVEDTNGNRETFCCSKDLWGALAGKSGRSTPVK